MNREDFFNQISKYYKVDKLVREKFDIYKNFLQEQNKIHNLTRLDKEEIIYREYFFDSIVPYIDYDFNNKELLDIGSGSGTPGIILKILFPKMNLTILESNLKKIKFMSNLCELLGFDDVIFLHQRAEEILENQKEKFDYVTSRAVASLKILLEISTPYLKINGLLIEPKSTNYQNEYEAAKDIIDVLGIELLEIKEITFCKNHFIFVFKKLFKTPNKFPRAWKEIIK